MDAIDRKILQMLERDARTPLKQLAKAVYLSSPAVSARIRNLEQQGILTGYRAVVDIQRIGYPIQAFINLEMEPRQKAEFYPWAGGEENILECNCVTGQYSMLLCVAFCRTMGLDQFIGKLQRFGRTQTQIVFSTPIALRAPGIVPPEEVLKGSKE